MIDKIEFMTLDTLPPAPTPEAQTQIHILHQLAFHPDRFRLVFFHLPADYRLHAKHALLNKWENDNAVGTIRSINTADFIAALIEAIERGNWRAELKHYEESDVLIVDDFQLAAGKEATQEHFFAAVLKPRMEAKKLTILFSEYSYESLSVSLRDDLRNLLHLGFH